MLALLSLVATAFASADAGPPLKGSQGKLRKAGTSSPGAAPISPLVGYRLSAKLTPTSGSGSSATGQWTGVIVHVVNGHVPSIPGCSTSAPKQAGPHTGVPTRPNIMKCTVGGGTTITVPGAGNHWLIGWKLTYSNLSSAVSGAQIHINAPTSAPVAAAPLCSTCTSGKFGHSALTEAQAKAIESGEGQVVVSTTNNPGGEISGAIVKVALKAASHH